MLDCLCNNRLFVALLPPPHHPTAIIFTSSLFEIYRSPLLWTKIHCCVEYKKEMTFFYSGYLPFYFLFLSLTFYSLSANGYLYTICHLFISCLEARWNHICLCLFFLRDAIFCTLSWSKAICKSVSRKMWLTCIFYSSEITTK